MKPKIINVKGKPHLVIISYNEYLDLIEAAKRPNQLLAPRPKQKLHIKMVSVADVADIPEEVRRRIANGESPVKAWRLYRDLTQVELAELAGVSHSTISLIENKERSGGIQTRIAIARAVNVPEHLLFNDLE